MERLRYIICRLKQVDNDGKFTYSNVVSLQNERGKTSLKLFPNPTHDIVFIEAENRQQSFVLYNAIGQVLYQANTIPDKLDMTKQAAGLYFLKVKQEELKFVKQ